MSIYVETPKPARSRSQSAATRIGAAAVLAFTALRFGAALPGPIEIDEVYWIGSAYYFDLLFEQRAPWHEDWQLLPAVENPPVGKYLIGLALRLGGHRETNPDRLALFYLHYRNQPGAWGAGEPFEKRQRVVERLSPSARRRPEVWNVPERVIRIGRGAMVAAGTATVLGLIACGWTAGRPLVGILAGFGFAAHPLPLGSASRVSVDLFALGFSTLAVVALIRLWRPRAADASRSRRGAIGLALWLGTALALACGSKMNAAVLVIVTGLLMLGSLARLARRRPASERRRLILLLGGLLISICLFIVINPALYPNPIAGCWNLIREHAVNVEVQAGFLDGFLETPRARLEAVFNLLSPQPAIGWFLMISLIFQTIITLIRGGARLVPCSWAWTAFVAVVLWIPFAWPRYALPVLPPLMLLAAWTLDDLRRAAMRLVARSARSTGSTVDVEPA